MPMKDLFADHFDTVIRRFDQALEASGYDTLLIYSGAPIRWYLDDHDYPFHCNPQFRALVPVSQPHSWVVYKRGQKPQLLFYRPRDIWHFVAPLPSDFWTSHFEITPLAEPGECADLLPSGAGVAVLGDCGADVRALKLGDLNPAALVARLDWERAYKTPYEHACLREASRIAVCGHRAAESAFRKGCSEFEINLQYMQATGQDSNQLPYNNIVALNQNSAILHYTVLEKNKPVAGQLYSFLIDAGADCLGYGSDITRSYAFSEGRFEELISAVDEAQLDLINAIEVGGSFSELHLRMHRNTAQVLEDFGILLCSADAAVESGITRSFLPHGLGHHLGIQVHDTGGHQATPEGGLNPPPADHPFLRNTRPIEEKQVLTIEPGLYFIDMLLNTLRDSSLGKEIDWGKVEQFRPFGGVRIEDDVIVHSDRVENMTREAFAAQ